MMYKVFLWWLMVSLAALYCAMFLVSNYYFSAFVWVNLNVWGFTSILYVGLKARKGIR